MKNTSKFILLLIFLLVLVLLFWAMPNKKIEVIGDFFGGIVEPLSIPLSIAISSIIGIKKLKKLVKGKSP